MTFVHMHDGETVYYETECEVCAVLESEGKSTNAILPEMPDINESGIKESFQFGALVGILRAQGNSEADLRAMLEFALSVCKGVK